MVIVQNFIYNWNTIIGSQLNRVKIHNKIHNNQVIHSYTIISSQHNYLLTKNIKEATTLEVQQSRRKIKQKANRKDDMHKNTNLNDEVCTKRLEWG
jgi:hypothetical protein